MNLITLAEYKLYAGIKSAEQDDKINALITSISSFVKSYCNRSFIDFYDTYKTEYYGQGYDILFLKEQPIVTDTSGNPELTVELKYYAGEAYQTAIADIDYIYDFELEALKSLNEDGFPKLPNAVKVTYKGGFDQTPEDLKLGIYDLITYYLKGESSPRKSLNSNQISVEYVKSSDLPAHIKRVFDLYRNIM